MSFAEIDMAPSVVAPAFQARVAKMYAPEATDVSGTLAPWWTNVVWDRIACNDGAPVPASFVAGYQQLFALLDELSEECEVSDEAIKEARNLLMQSMFSGAVPPRMSWHGKSSVVFFWTVGKTTSFFTISAEEFSYLEETNGNITSRRDDIPFYVWSRIFPLANGNH